jgi:hypothetical protein
MSFQQQSVNPVLATSMENELLPFQAGAPLYPGAVDYPDTVYKGYPGSQGYIIEPNSPGYNLVSTDKVYVPEITSTSSLNKNPEIQDCDIPSYFVENENIVSKCTNDWAFTLFKLAIISNTVFSLLFYKQINKTYIILFILFHIALYFFITKLFVGISISEWRTYQEYKHAIKTDPYYSRFDTPVIQFNTINDFLRMQPINKQRVIYIILAISFIFIWAPLIFNLSSKDEMRIDIHELKRK